MWGEMGENRLFRGRSRRVAKLLQESIFIAFDFKWKVMLFNRNFATLPDPPLSAVGIKKSVSKGWGRFI